MYINTSAIRVFLLATLTISAALPIFAQDSKEATIIGTVVGIKRPDMWGWIMHTRYLDEYYVRVDKVIKGAVISKYVIIGHAYNAPEQVLPKDILSGKHRWKFRISLFAEWDGMAASVLDETNPVETVKPTEKPDEITKELLKSIPGNENTFVITPALIWTEPVKGLETEAATLERRGILKAYYLQFKKGNPKKID